MAQIAEGKARRAKQRDVRPLQALAPLIAAHRGLAIAAMISLIASTALTLGISGAARLAIDHGFTQASAGLLNR